MKAMKFLAVFTVIAVLLAACGAKTTPTAAPEPTKAPAATEAPAAEVVVTEAPAAEDAWGYITIPAGESLIVGVSTSLSGGTAVYGQDIKNGVDLAIEKFGGTLKGFTLTSDGQDDLCEGAAGVTVAEKFSADPSILGVIGPMCSGSVVPAADIYANNKVIMITTSSTAVAVTAQGYENVFRTVANDALQAEATVDYLINELGLESIAIIQDQSIYGEGLANAVSADFTTAGGTVTSNQGINRGESDYSAVISTSIADNPDAVYFGGMDAEGMKVVVQLRQAGYEGIFFGPDGIKSQPTFADAAGAAAEGAYMTFGAVGGASGADEFTAAYNTKFGSDPVAYGPGSYDAATILLQAADKVATVDAAGNLVIGKKALADAIRSTPFTGVTGQLEFNEIGDLKIVSITVFNVIDGTITPQKTYDFGK